MQYTFEPECRFHGPLAQAAIAGFPSMTVFRRPMVEPESRTERLARESAASVSDRPAFGLRQALIEASRPISSEEEVANAKAAQAFYAEEAARLVQLRRSGGLP